MKDLSFLAENPAMLVASRSSWCSKKKERSSLSTSRSTTPVKALLAYLAAYSSPPACEHGNEPFTPGQAVSEMATLLTAARDLIVEREKRDSVEGERVASSEIPLRAREQVYGLPHR